MGDKNFDDEEISLSPARKSAPKQGRRAAINEDQAFAERSLGSPLKSRPVTGDFGLGGDEEGNGPVGRAGGTAPPRRAGGWADENSRAKTARSQSGRGTRQGNSYESGDEDTVPAIPDLEEVEQEDLALQVADAPSVAVNRVATYKELDTDLFKHAAFATLDDIDLRLLTRCLAPESAVKEVDEPWSWDILFTDVSSELIGEWFPDTEEEKKDTIKERPYTAFNRFPV